MLGCRRLSLFLMPSAVSSWLTQVRRFPSTFRWKAGEETRRMKAQFSFSPRGKGNRDRVHRLHVGFLAAGRHLHAPGPARTR